MIRKSHVAIEFIYVAIGNGYYTSGKLVAIKHSVCDRALGEQQHALDAPTTEVGWDRGILS